MKARITKYDNDLIRNRAITILRNLSVRNKLTRDELGIIGVFLLLERYENKALKEYEDLKEQGKILKLPCEIGERVYKIYRFLDEGAWEIDEHKIKLEDLAVIGETVFLSREEAEAKIKDLENSQPN